MMHASLDIRFEGREFYPSKLKGITGLPIKVLAEFGEISSKGRYKGKPSPYGMGVLEISEPGKQVNIPELIHQYTNKLIENKSGLRDCGVEEIIFDIESSKEFSSDISLSQMIVKNLSELNARVEFHTTDDVDDLKTIVEKVKNKFPGLMKEELYSRIKNGFVKHPSISHADILYYFIFLYSKQSPSGNFDESLADFEHFYNEVANL